MKSGELTMGVEISSKPKIYISSKLYLELKDQMDPLTLTLKLSADTFAAKGEM
jgi:hypothetical protein